MCRIEKWKFKNALVCIVNVHEKTFWPNYFRKRPAADLDDDNAVGNETRCCEFYFSPPPFF